MPAVRPTCSQKVAMRCRTETQGMLNVSQMLCRCRSTLAQHSAVGERMSLISVHLSHEMR